MAPKVIEKNTIEQIIAQASISDLLTVIEQAYTNYSNKNAVVPPVGTLTFEKPPGDVHIKYGYIKGGDNYVIKIASGFYNNPDFGLGSSNGLNLVFNQKNGLLETILLDEGYLTDIRTAVGGAVAAKYLSPRHINKIGIVGTGIQARLQLEYISKVISCKDVLVWGRSEGKLQKYRDDMKPHGYNIDVTKECERITKECNLIVTTTPSQSPILKNSGLEEGTLIIAMGADTEGKQELDTNILEEAALIVPDSYSQCQHHGEIHKAYQANLLSKVKMKELGEIINDNGFVRRESDIIIADLTGIATQDIQISKYVLDHL